MREHEKVLADEPLAAGEARMAGARSVLATFAAGNFFFHWVTTLLVPMLPLIRESFHLSYLESGLLVTGYTAALALTQLPMALRADRLPKRLLASMGLLGVASAAVLAGTAQYYYSLATMVITMGIFAGMYRAPASTLVTQAFSPSERGRAMGVSHVGGSMGHLVAPVAAGAIAAAGGWRPVFLLLSLPAAAMSIVVWLVAGKTEAAIKRLRQAGLTNTPDWKRIARVAGVFVLLALAQQFVETAVNAYLPLFLVDRHGVPAAQAAMLVGLFYGSGMIGAPLGGALSDRFGRRPIILLSVAVAGPAVICIGLAASVPLVIAAVMVFGVTVGFRGPVVDSLIADLVPWEQRVRALSVFYFMAQLVAASGTAAAGALMDALGPPAAFTGLGVFAGLMSLLVLARWKSIR
jgi:MFS transporter, FSR family, fosmidomycin resistance protein